MNRLAEWWSHSTVRYATYEALFGLSFPIAATVMDFVAEGVPFTLAAVLHSHAVEPSHWLIDTAPFVLGLIAGLLGKRQDQIHRMTLELEQKVAERTADLLTANETLQQENVERRRVEAILSRAKLEWETTFDAVMDLIIMADPEGRVARCNRATSIHFNRPYKEDDRWMR